MQKSKKRARVGRVLDSRKCSENSRVVSEYLASLKRRRYSPQTIATFKLPLGQFISFLAAAENQPRLQDVSRLDIEAWSLRLTERKLTEATRNIYLRAVRNLFNWMESESMLFDNPAATFIIPRHQRKLQPVHSCKEISQLLEQPSPTTPTGIRDRAIIEIGYSCALRREELTRLTLHDPDYLQSTLRVTGKGNRERMLPLGAEAVAWLRNYTDKARGQLLKHNHHDDRTTTDRLWINNYGNPISGQGINVMIKQHGRDAGIKTNVTTHALRRACVTHMLQNGAHPVQIQMLLGHADMSHLSQYLRLTIVDIKQMHQNSKPGK